MTSFRLAVAAWVAVGVIIVIGLAYLWGKLT